MINFDTVWDKFVEIAQDYAGSNLSMSGPLGDEPCVIRESINGPLPDYPYITVNIADVSDESNWLIDEYIDENDNIVYRNIKTLLITYRCYGGEADTPSPGKSIDIMNILHGAFRFDSVRGDVRNTLNGSIVELTTIESLPVQLKDKILDSSSFNIIFNIVDEAVDTNSFIIDTVDVTGDVYSLQGDLTSDQITINVTN